MSDQHQAVVSHHELLLATRRTYVTGFLLSVVLTIAAYLLVVHHLFSRQVLMGVLVALALVQFFAQLLFFLHLGRESKPRWRLLVFIFMTLIVGIIVGGSLWIMASLNSRMRYSPAQIDQYVQSQAQQGL